MRLLLQLLLQSLLSSQRLLLQSLLKLLLPLLRLLLQLQRLLLLLPLLLHERLEHPFATLIAPPRGFRGGAPIFLEALLHRRGCGGRSAPILIDAPLHLERLLQQLRLLLLLLQKAKD